MGHFEISLGQQGASTVRVSVSSVDSFKGTVGLSFTYGGSPSPPPEISPTSSSVYLGRGGQDYVDVSIGSTVGWIFQAFGESGNTYDYAELPIE